MLLRIVTVVALSVAVAVAVAPQAWAPVPPRDCGNISAKGKRYNIRADVLRCRRARTHADRYLTFGRRPSGYRCRNYGRGTRIKFRCSRGSRVIFAIRR